MTAAIKLKRGATFSLVCTYQQPPGTAVDITSFSIKSQVRVEADNSLVTDLSVTKNAEVTGQFVLSSATDAWPTCNLLCDIFYVSNGVQVASDTIKIFMVKNITDPIQ